MKIGILGGSFDPIHDGHVYICKQAIQQLKLDKMILMVAKQAPMKDDYSTSFADRYAMALKAIIHEDQIEVSDLENHLPSPSYSYNTMVHLQKAFPNDTFYWLIGADQIEKLDAWYKIDELVQMVDFVGVARDQNRVKSPYLKTLLQVDKHPAKSSDIRQGKIDDVNKEVLAYIMEHHLYQEAIAYRLISEKRKAHVESTTLLCEKLAKAHGLDVEIARQIGLFHDCAKNFTFEQLQRIMEKYYPQHIHMHPNVWHQYVGAYYAEHVLQIKNQIVINAIKNHTTGSNEVYTMLIFCADKCEPTRGYDSDKMIEKCMQNLKKGYQMVYRNQQMYLSKGSD